jgi:RNA polymerase sigma factor (sigma-70 family)
MPSPGQRHVIHFEARRDRLLRRQRERTRPMTKTLTPSNDVEPTMSPCAEGAIVERHLSPQFMAWQALMTAAAAGDDTAYTQLLQDVRAWLCAYFYRRLAPNLAEDATQDVLLAVHVRRSSAYTTPLGPRVVAVARNKWLDRMRRHYSVREQPLTENLSIGDQGAAARSKLVVEATLRALKPSQAKVIRLVKLHGASVEEASRATGQSSALVRVNIHRGLRKMARFLEVDYGGAKSA